MIALYIVRVVKNKRKSAKSEAVKRCVEYEKIWSRIRDRWRLFWRDDEYDLSIKHLSESDKGIYGMGTFMVWCLLSPFCSLAIAFQQHPGETRTAKR